MAEPKSPDFNLKLKESGIRGRDYGVNLVSMYPNERLNFKFAAMAYDAAKLTNFEDKNEVIRYQDKINNLFTSLWSSETNPKDYGLSSLIVDGQPGPATWNVVKNVENYIKKLQVTNPAEDLIEDED